MTVRFSSKKVCWKIALVWWTLFNLTVVQAASVGSGSYLYGENIGWIKMAVTSYEATLPDPGVAGALTGWLWGESVGWISLNCANTGTCATSDYRVSVDYNGYLSGYAWSETTGWYNFGHGLAGSEPRIDTLGQWSGFIWGENVGWVKLDHAQVDNRPVSTWTVDNQAPESWVLDLPAFTTTSSWLVRWQGNDAGGSALATYEVQYRDGESGAWQVLESATTNTSRLFTGGEDNHCYYFRSAARDVAGNVEPWPGTYDTRTCVDLSLPTAETMMINNNQAYTNNALVELTLSAQDMQSGTGADVVGGVEKMKIINSLDSHVTGADFATAAEQDYTPTVSNWSVTTAPATTSDGEKTVCVIFIDRAGNTSAPQCDTIFLDTTLPTNATLAQDLDDELGSGAPNAWGENDNYGWQNTHHDPHFTLAGGSDAGSGVKGYYVYFGPDPNGVVATDESSGSFYAGNDLNLPILSTTGARYLRVRAQDQAGNLAATWETLFVHKYDIDAPDRPVVQITPNTWTHVAEATLTWTAPADVGSGVSEYRVTTEPVVTVQPSLPLTTTDTTASLVYSNLSDGAVSHQVVALDRATNSSPAGEVTFYYDATSPSNVGTVMDNGEGNGVATNGVWGNAYEPNFVWTAATDTTSGVATYDIYWGPLADGQTVTATVATNAYNPANLDPILNANQTWYLRIRSRDVAGNLNVAGFETKFVYRYTRAPLSPSALGPADVVNGGWIADNTPSFEFRLTDPDNDPLGYTFWLADNAAFDNPVVIYNYTGDDLVSGELATFTVGQAATAGSYQVGEAGQVLTDGVYFWRVQAHDAHGADRTYSSTVTAHDGAMAFGLESIGQPVITSTTHPLSTVASNSPVAIFNWTTPAATSGIAGYSYVIDDQAATEPDETVDTNQNTLTISDLTDGLWYLHLRARSNGGLVGETVHYAYLVDRTPPASTNLQLVINDVSSAATNVSAVTLHLLATDEQGGVVGMKIKNQAWDDLAPVDFSEVVEEPYLTQKTGWEVSAAPANGSDGPKRVCAIFKDQAGNWSSAVCDNIIYDTTAPINPTSAVATDQILIGGPVSEVWQSQYRQPRFSWAAGSDEGSGVRGYYVYWGTEETGTVALNNEGENFVLAGQDYSVATPVTESGVWYLRVRAKDEAGNLAAGWTTIFVFRYDHEAPATPLLEWVVEHPVDETNVWTNQLTQVFRWTAPSDWPTGSGASGIANYTYRASVETTPVTPLTTVDRTTSLTINNLVAGINNFFVLARDQAGNEGPEAVAPFRFDVDAPPVVNAATVMDINGSQNDIWTSNLRPHFYWTPVEETAAGTQSGVWGYEVYWGPVADGTTVVATTTTADYYPGAVSAESTHYLRLRTLDYAGNNSGWQTVYTFRSSTAPLAPQNLGPTAVANGSWSNNGTPDFSFTLEDPDQNSLGYRLTISPDSTFATAAVIYEVTGGIPAGSQVQYHLGETGSGTYLTGQPGMQLADGVYYWKVQSWDEHGLGGGETTANYGQAAFRIDTTPPNGAVILAVEPLSDHRLQIRVNGTDVGSGLASTPYLLTEVSGKPGAGPFTYQTSNVFVDTDLDVNTEYVYQVTVRDLVGNEYTGPVTVSGYTWAAPVQGAVVDTAYDLNAGQYKNVLSWNEPAMNVVINSVTTGSEVFRGAATTFTDWGVAANTAYQYNLQTINAAGVVSGDPVSLTVTTPPRKVTNVQLAQATESTIAWTWSPLAEATAYQIYNPYDTASGAILETTATGAVIDYGYLPNTGHAIVVRAVNARGVGQPSETASAFTAAGLPYGLQLLDTNPSSMTWQWQRQNLDDLSYASLTGTSLYKDWTVDSGSGSWQTWTATGTTANTLYELAVRAKNQSGVETATVTSAAYSAIETPVGVLADAASLAADSLKLEMDGSLTNLEVGEAGWLMEEMTSGRYSGWQKVTRTWLATGLTPDTEYQYRAQARNADGRVTEWSTPLTVLTLAQVPHYPQLEGAQAETFRIDARAIANGNPTGTVYRFAVDPDGDEVWSDSNVLYVQMSGSEPGEAALSGAATWQTAADWQAVTVRGLTPGKLYRVRCQARNQAGVETGWSEANIISTNSAPQSVRIISMPSSYTAQTQPHFVFGISDHDAGDQVGYQVVLERVTGTGTEMVLDYRSAIVSQSGSGDTIFDYTVGQAAADGEYQVGAAGVSLAEGEYQLKIKGIDNYGLESAFTTPRVFFIDTTAPQEISNLVAEKQAGDVVQLSWVGSPSADIAGYQLLINDVPWSGNPISALSNSVLLTGQTPGEYEYRLQSVDIAENRSAGVTLNFTLTSGSSGGGSSSSSTPTETTPSTTPAEPVDTTPPAVVQNFGGVVEGSNFKLTWQDPADSDLNHLEVYRRWGETDWTPVVNVSAGTQQYVENNPTSNQEYAYQIVAVDHRGNRSAVSATVRLSIDNLKPTSRISGDINYTNLASLRLEIVGQDSGGLRYVQVWSSYNDGPYTRVVTEAYPTGEFSVGAVNVALPQDGRYAFKSQAVDVSGNVEDLPSTPDYIVNRLTVLPTLPEVSVPTTVTERIIPVTFSNLPSPSLLVLMSGDVVGTNVYNWIPLTANNELQLSEGFGSKELRIQYKDLAGNLSAVITRTINYQAPVEVVPEQPETPATETTPPATSEPTTGSTDGNPVGEVLTGPTGTVTVPVNYGGSTAAEENPYYVAPTTEHPAADIDTDGDGLVDSDELRYGTSPKLVDTDGDGLKDGEEVKELHTNPLLPDTDNDGLSDYNEVKYYRTNPLEKDTDGDTYGDSEEISAKTDPLDPLSHPQRDADTQVDTSWLANYQEKRAQLTGTGGELPGQTIGTMDSDHDGLADKLEYTYGTDPFQADSDYDQWSDGQEVLDYGTDPLDPNSYPGKTTKLLILNWHNNDVSGDTTPLIRGVGRANAPVEIFMTKDGQQISLGQVMTDAEGKFVLVATVALVDGVYTMQAVTYDSFQVPNDYSAQIKVIIDSTLTVPQPEVSAVDESPVTVDVDQITTENQQPTVYGTTYYGSSVEAIFQSLMTTSSVIADSPAGDFAVQAARPLEVGAHRVIVYAKTVEGARSQEVSVPFLIIEPAHAAASAEIDWRWLIFALLIMVNVGWFSYYRYYYVVKPRTKKLNAE